MLNKKVLLAAAIAAAALLQGCASHVYNKEALSQRNNRFAIVSFGGLTSGLGMDEEADAKMISGLDDVVYQELSRSKHFTLVRPLAVKGSRSYALIKGEPTDGMYTMKVAKGYKKFDPKKETEAVRKLMDELKLSGVIQVAAYYGKKEQSVFVSGLLKLPGVSGGVANGHITYSVVAYNNKAEVIWQDTVEATTNESTLLVMGIANVAKLYPQLVDITQEASRLALKNLDEKVAAN
jgi:hypothetical protein